MFLRRAACGLAIVLLAVSTVHAQAASPDSPASDRDEDYGLVHPGEDPQNEVGWPLLRHIADDQRTFWTAPFRLHADDLKTVVPFLGITAGFMAGDSAISRQVPDSPSSLKRSLDLSNFTAYSMIGGAGAMFFWGHLTHNDHKREAGFLSGEAAINSAAIVYFTKSIARRERPMEANGDGAFFQGGSSFPSEHAAVAWSVASVVAHEYPGWLTQFLAYGAATGVSLTRVTAKQHFPADVIVGSALGWYLGRQVYRAHHDPELGGAAWGSTQRFPEEKPRDTNSMGSPYVSLDSWMYPAFERLAALGYVQSQMSGIRPWTRMECARLLEEARERIPDDEGYSTQVSLTYRALERELSPELERQQGAANVDMKIESMYSRFTGISGTPMTDGYNFGRTVINDYGRPFQEGANSANGASAYATAGPFAFYARGEYQHAPTAPGFPDTVREAVASQEGVPVQPYSPIAAVDRFRLLEGYVSVAFRGLQISAGKQDLSWGPTETGSLMWSNNAEPVPMIRINNVEPFKLPGFLHWLGPMRTEFFLGQLGGHQFILNANGTVAPNPFKPQPYVQGQKLSFKPTPNLEFGFSRTIVMGGPGHPFTLGTFWKSFSSVGDPTAFSATSDVGDRRSGFDFSYRIPGLRKWLVLYSDSFCDDDVSPLAAPTRCAWSPGIYMPQVPHLPRFDFRAEGVTTDVWGFPFSGVNYQNIIYPSGYTNYGNIIGNWVGRQGRGVQLWGTYWISPQSKIQAQYRYQGVNPEFLQGGRLDDLSVRTELMLRPDLAFTGLAQYERWNFPLLATTTKSNVAVSIGFTYRPDWKLTRK